MKIDGPLGYILETAGLCSRAEVIVPGNELSNEILDAGDTQVFAWCRTDRQMGIFALFLVKGLRASLLETGTHDESCVCVWGGGGVQRQSALTDGSCTENRICLMSGFSQEANFIFYTGLQHREMEVRIIYCVRHCALFICGITLFNFQGK